MSHALCLSFLCAATAGPQPRVAARIRAHTEHLASDELRGRGTGSKEIRLAAEYIAAQFKAIGLQPFAADSYFQEFPMPGQDGPELGSIHTPADEVTDQWNWDGVADHLALYEAIADHFLENPDGIGITDPELFARE